jgi:hypothetical protein
MMKWMIAAFLVALVVPVAAFADGAAATPASTANQICKQAQTTMGASAFGSSFGTNKSKSNAFGKCVSKNAQNAQTDVNNAAKSCKAERTAGPAAFITKYGTNGKPGSTGAGKNAFGKCVSTKAKALANAQAAAAPSAAKQCKSDAKSDPTAYAANYGNGSDALGKCVAKLSHSK